MDIEEARFIAAKILGQSRESAPRIDKRLVIEGIAEELVEAYDRGLRDRAWDKSDAFDMWLCR